MEFLTPIITAFENLRQANRRQERQWKYDVLRRICGYRFRLGEGYIKTKGYYDGEPYIALNEALIAFSKHSEVKAALDEFNNEDSAEKIANLIRAMAKASDVDISDISDRRLKRALSPPSWAERGKD